jgi:type VI protein secretion system component Hcp
MSLDGHPDLQSLGVVAIHWTARNTVDIGGGGAGTGKVAFDLFTVTKAVDASSPALLALTFGATKLPTVQIDVTIRRGVVATYELSDVLITANERRVPDGGGAPLQDVSFAATKIRETVTSPAGTVTSCFDLKENKACDTPP